MNNQILLKMTKELNLLTFVTDFDPDINLPLRYSMDKIITSGGKHLNEMCIQTGLRILNGRTTGDCI